MKKSIKFYVFSLVIAFSLGCLSSFSWAIDPPNLNLVDDHDLDIVMKIKYYPRYRSGNTVKDIKWARYEYPDENDPTLGIRKFSTNDLKVDLKEAIEILHSVESGAYFINISLYHPLCGPSCDEPIYWFRLNSGKTVKIGAITGRVE